MCACLCICGGDGDGATTTTKTTTTVVAAAAASVDYCTRARSRKCICAREYSCCFYGLAGAGRRCVARLCAAFLFAWYFFRAVVVAVVAVVTAVAVCSSPPVLHVRSLSLLLSPSVRFAVTALPQTVYFTRLHAHFAQEPSQFAELTQTNTRTRIKTAKK